MFRRILSAALRVAIVVAAVLVLLWWFGMKMPGKNVSKTGPLSPDEIVLREELRANVQKLAGEIGERNMWHYAQLNTAADFIEILFREPGCGPDETATRRADRRVTTSRQKSRGIARR